MGFENGKLVAVQLRAVAPSGNSETNTLHYDLNDNNDVQPNDPQSLADFFRDNVRPNFIAMYDSGWSIQPVIVREEKDPQNPTDPTSEWQSGSATPGTKTSVSNPLAPGHVGVCTLRTSHVGKRFRGRIFLGGIKDESELDFRTWQSAIITRWQTYVSSIPMQPDIAGPGSGAVADWCVYSRTQRAANLDPYASHVQTATVNTALHWLRSRQRI